MRFQRGNASAEHLQMLRKQAELLKLPPGGAGLRDKAVEFRAFKGVSWGWRSLENRQTPPCFWMNVVLGECSQQQP